MRRQSAVTDEGFFTLVDRERTITYHLFRKSIKNINAKIRPDGEIRVSAPLAVPLYKIEDFLRLNMPYILRVQKRYEKEALFKNRLSSYCSGETFCHLGNVITLAVEEGWTENVSLKGSTLNVIVRDEKDWKHTKRLVNAWLQKQQECLILGICREKIPLFEKYGVHEPEIRIKNLQSKWGSCTPSKNLLVFSGKLAETPLKCIEYVVIHELSHYVEQNHSPAFYGIVAEFMPDYRIWDEKLNHYH